MCDYCGASNAFHFVYMTDNKSSLLVLSLMQGVPKKRIPAFKLTLKVATSAPTYKDHIVGILTILISNEQL